MTLQELAKKINRSEITIKKEFPRTQAQFAKLGIIITKTGKGKTTEYFIEYRED